jgi:DsbC/DsbD-like thiol-disulfide interchange protein
MSRRFALPVLLLLLISIVASAQMYHGVQVSHVSLVSGSVKPGKPFTLGIHVAMDPGWHTYWKTPGDAGAPPTVELLDSPDYTASELRFPTPHKRVADDIVSYVYEDEVVYLLQVRPKNQNPAHHLKLKVHWLICKDLCLPADTILEFNIDSLTKERTNEDQKLLDRWTARLPQPGMGFNLDRSGAIIHPENDTKLSVFLKFFDMAPNTIVDFFPYDQDQIAINYNSIAVTSDGISMSVERSNKNSDLKYISGIVIIGTTGYEVSVPVSKQ